MGAQKTFNWAHLFPRSLYDPFAGDLPDKEAAYRALLGHDLDKPEAITHHRLDLHGKLWSFIIAHYHGYLHRPPVEWKMMPMFEECAPEHTRTTLLADVFVERTALKGEDRLLGAEVGVRYQWTTQAVLDLGLGRPLDGLSDRRNLTVEGGLSLAF